MQLLRQGDESAFGNRLRAPLDALAPFENVPHDRMRLQLLQKIVHGELGVAVVEPDDHPERDHVGAERIDERTAELAIARVLAKRPAQRVDDAVERPRHLPDLLHAERPHLRTLARQSEPLDRRAGQVALRSFAENGDTSDDVRARLEVGERLAVTRTPPVAGAHAAHAPMLDEKLRRRRLGQDRRSDLLGLLAEPSPELGHRRDVVVVVLHRRRRRHAHRLVARQVIDGLAADLAVERHVRDPLLLAEEGRAASAG